MKLDLVFLVSRNSSEIELDILNLVNLFINICTFFVMPGFYCIYKAKGSLCPRGMTKGFVLWDDETLRNVNSHSGTLPDGEYNSNTKIKYCCQNMGKWFNPIDLPIRNPFYLLPHNSSTLPQCQLVKWTKTWLEYIDYDTEDIKSVDTFSGDHVFLRHISTSKIISGVFTFLRVHYCYYEGMSNF